MLGSKTGSSCLHLLPYYVQNSFVAELAFMVSWCLRVPCMALHILLQDLLKRHSVTGKVHAVPQLQAAHDRFMSNNAVTRHSA